MTAIIFLAGVFVGTVVNYVLMRDTDNDDDYDYRNSGHTGRNT